MRARGSVAVGVLLLYAAQFAGGLIMKAWLVLLNLPDDHFQVRCGLSRQKYRVVWDGLAMKSLQNSVKSRCGVPA